jgi:hypothetical protein
LTCRQRRPSLFVWCLGLTAEDLARAAVVDLLASTGDDFATAAERILKKNEELYRRLAVMRYLTLAEIVDLHRRLLQATGGSPGIRDLGALESAIAQPKATFGNADLYPHSG